MSYSLILLLLLFPSLVLTNIISLTTTCSNCTLNTPTTYTFYFRRNTNPINISISQTVTVVPTDAYIQITFPSSFTSLTNGNYTCTTNTSVSLNCSMASNLLTVTGYYNSSNVAVSDNVILVQGVTNPSKTGSSGEFQYAIKNSAGVVLD